MAILGPMVVVAENPATDLIDILGKAGAFPIIEARWTDAPAAIAQINPSAIAIAEPSDPHAVHVSALTQAIEGANGPFMPVITRVTADGEVPMLGALPVDIEEPISHLVARVRSALRVRTLHATVSRRAKAAGLPTKFSNPILGDELLEEAIVLCVGRGRAYPELSVAIGERVGVIGALSVEAAARCLSARDIDGVVIGDGFPARVVIALLTALAEDARFRDLPIGVLGGTPDPIDEQLPNLIRVAGEPAALVRRLIPFVRLQAFEARLKRMLTSLEAQGLIDPDTGLLHRAIFWQDLERASADAAERGGGLSVARFAFEGPVDKRAMMDAARLVSRLVRDVDVACQDTDGSILIGFTETDLRAAHVVARRIATTLKHTMISPDLDRRSISPSVTLATLKPRDNLYSMMARISAYPAVAAE